MKRLRKGELPPLTYIYTKCKICNEVKDDALFKYQKGKRAGLVCRKCDSEIKRSIYNSNADISTSYKNKSKEWYYNNLEKAKENAKIYRENHPELKDKKKQYRLNNLDRENTRSKEWYQNNKHTNEYKEYRENYVKVNKDAIDLMYRSYYSRNKQGILYRNSQYRKNNRGLLNAYYKCYKVKKINRTPTWANLQKIAEIYKNCPVGYEVDHIVPLHGKLVSGLHVENNLQYLTAHENQTKSNKFEVS